MSINAMHAMPDGGDLTITTSNEYLNKEQAALLELAEGDYVKLSLKDNGLGMDEETRQKIFDPFFTTKAEGGTGLGMSQVYGFVKQSGGSISLVSEPDEGTCFKIYLPRSQTIRLVNDVETAIVDLDTNIVDATILVVDDEKALRELTSKNLSNRGYHVLLAESGKKALELLEQHKVNIMLSDVIMPEMSGYELARQVKKTYPDVKIQMISGYSDEAILNEEDKILYDERLLKPCATDLLLQRLHELLKK